MPFASDNRMKIGILSAVLVFAAGCSGSPSPPAATSSQPPPPVAFNEHPNVTATAFRIEPGTIRLGGTAKVTAEIPSAPANVDVTVFWFGPDGWNVADQSLVMSAGKTTAAVPAAVTGQAGRYHAELRAGVDDLASADLTVTD